LERLQGVAYLTSRPRNPSSGLGADFHMKVSSIILTTLLMKMKHCVKLKFQVVGQVKQALWKGTNRKTISSQYCTITLKPPLILDNLLPAALGYFVSGTNQLITTEKGNCVQITDIEIHKKEFELKLKVCSHLTYCVIHE
jgi:hypothetical protein